MLTPGTRCGLSSFVLRLVQQELDAEQKQYLKDTPELRAIVSDFLLYVLQRKPEDTFATAASYFARYRSTEGSA